jgi:hypothetical protein
VAAQRAERAVHAPARELLADHRLASFPADVVDDEAADDRSERGAADVDRQERLAPRHHGDHEQVHYFGEREEGRVEEGDETEARRAERQGQRPEIGDQSHHRINR